MELVKVDIQEFGIEENIALNLSNAFKPMLEKMADMEDEFNSVMSMEFNIEKMARCKNLRQRYVKIRTGTDKIHKAEKEKYLTVGRAIDAFKNTQKAASMGKEEQLAEVEKHYDNIEKQRIANIQEERKLELETYEADYIPENLGTMEEPVWKNYISGIKGNYDRRIEAEKKAELERIELEKAEMKRNIEIAKENKHLKAEAIKREKIEAERKAKEKAEQEKRDKEESKRKEDERIKQEKHDREIADAKDKADKDIKKREIAEAELAAFNKANAEEMQREKERKAAEIEAELNKGDNDRVIELVNELELICNKYTFKSSKNRQMFNEVTNKINAIIEFIENQE